MLGEHYDNNKESLGEVRVGIQWGGRRGGGGGRGGEEMRREGYLDMSAWGMSLAQPALIQS